MDEKHYHSTDTSPLSWSDLFSCYDKISAMSDDGSAALGDSVEVKFSSVYFISQSLAILDVLESCYLAITLPSSMNL